MKPSQGTPCSPRQGRGVPGTQNKARAARSPPGPRLPAWSSPRLSSSSSSGGGGDGGQNPGRRRCSAPAAAGAAAQEGAALTPMPVHAGLVRSGEGGGAGAVAGPGLWLRHGPGGAPRFLLFFLSGQRPRAATAAARNRASRAEGGGHGARTHRGGRTRQAEREERYKDRERAPEAAAGARAAGPPAGVGSARVDRPDLTSRGSQRPGELRTRGLHGQSISASHSRPAPPSFHQSAQVPPPGRAPPPFPIGCKRASRPRTALVRLTQVPRPPPAGGAASLGPSLLPPASLGFFSSTPFPLITAFWYPIEKGDSDFRLARVPGEPAFNLSLN